jgi:catechol-2,3-dioxygenase
MARTLPSDPPVPAKFAHFVLRTRRMEPLRDWWRNLLRARVAFENDLVCFMTYDDEHHRLAIVAIPALQDSPEGGVGLDHVAYTYSGLGDLLATYERLKKDGILPYWAINHGPTTSLYYRDPDGNQVELQVDNFGDSEALNGWFRSGAFEKNPIGVEFDVEKLIERFRNGDPIGDLVKQGAA